MKKLLLLLILSLFSIQANAGSCSDGSDPVKSISDDGTYFVYKCGGASNNSSSSTSSSSTANSSTANSTTKAFDGEYPFELSRFNPSEGPRGLGSGILVIKNGTISVSPKNRFLDTSPTKYYDTLKGRVDKKGNTSITFDVNALHGKGKPSKVSFSGNINNLQIKGSFDDYFQLIIALSDDTSSMSSDGLTMSASKNSGYGSHTNTYGHKKKNFQLVTNSNKARRGEKYQRFEVGDGDCFADDGWNDCDKDRERVEFTAAPRMKPDGNQCFAYSIMLDESFQSVSPTNTTLGQIHQIGGPKGYAGGLSSVPPVIQFDARNDYFDLNFHELIGSSTNVTDKSIYYQLIPISDMKGKWTDISFCLDFVNKNISVWVNGEKKLNIDTAPINTNLKPSSIYFKHGIYRSFISK